MDISSTSLANSAMSLQKKQADSDIMQRSLEKMEAVPVEQKEGEAKQVEKTSSDKQGRIDFYA